MKKLFLMLALVSVVAFSACTVKFGSNGVEDEKIEKLEKEIERLEEKLDEEDEEEAEPEEEEKAEEEKKEEEKDGPTVGGVSLINVVSPKDDSYFDYSPLIFEGVVSPNTKKIVVTAVGGHTGYCDVVCDPYYEDVYTLRDFKEGDETFTYRARYDWNNLARGTNTYTFKAYFKDGSTDTDKVSVTYDPNKLLFGNPNSGAVAEVGQAFKEYSGIYMGSTYIDQNIDNKYVTGGFYTDGGGGHFWAKKVGGRWTIAATGQDSVPCSQLAGFPSPMKDGCY